MNNFGDTFLDNLSDNSVDNFVDNFSGCWSAIFRQLTLIKVLSKCQIGLNSTNIVIYVSIPIFSRNLTKYPKEDRFDVSSQHGHSERPNNLKIALIHERELTSDHSGPTIYDIELVHYLQSKPELFYYLKVIIYIVKIVI